MRGRKQKSKRQSEIDSANSRSEVVLLKVWNYRMIKFRKWCLHLKTRVELFSKTWVFWKILIVFVTKHSQQSSRKVKRGPENVISQLLKHKRETWKNFTRSNIFQQLWTMKVQTSVFWKFCFYIPNTFRLRKSGTWKKY